MQRILNCQFVSSQRFISEINIMVTSVDRRKRCEGRNGRHVAGMNRSTFRISGFGLSVSAIRS